MLDDDVWDSESEKVAGHQRASNVASELDREWQSRQNQFHTLGYRDGIEEGKTSSVQQGFNLGYAEATVAGFNWGIARGLTSAFAALPADLKVRLLGESGAIGRFEGLNFSISSLSSTDALRSFYRDSIQPLEVKSLDSDALLESRVSQEDPRGDAVSYEEGALGCRDKTESGPMAGIDRLPETHDVGKWETREAEKVPGHDSSIGGACGACGATETCKQEHLEQSDSSGSCYTTSTPGPGRATEHSSVLSLLLSKEVMKEEGLPGYSRDDTSLTIPSSAKRTELEELEWKVHSELGLAR